MKTLLDRKTISLSIVIISAVYAIFISIRPIHNIMTDVNSKIEKKLDQEILIINKKIGEEKKMKKNEFLKKLQKIIPSDKYRTYFVSFIEKEDSFITQNDYEIYVLARILDSFSLGFFSVTPIIPKEKIYKMKVGESVKEIKQLPEKILFPIFSDNKNIKDVVRKNSITCPIKSTN